MAVKQLIETLQNFDENMEVLIAANPLLQYPLGSIIGVGSKGAVESDDGGWFKEDNAANTTEFVIIE